MTSHSLHQRLIQKNVHERESVVERLPSRWSSCSLIIVDRPPSQPLSRRQMSGRPSSGSVKESHHKDPGTGNSRRESAAGRLQRNSKWTSGSGVITDSPPLQPPSRRGSGGEKLQQGGSKWRPGSLTAFDKALSQALVRHRMIVRPRSVSPPKHSAAMNNHDIFESTSRTPFIMNLSRIHLSHAANGTGLQ
jgi:hypothetical protein